MGVLGLFYDKIFKWILSQFFQLFEEVFSTCFRAKYFHLKGEFIKSFQSDFFLEFSSTISILVFSHNT